MERLTTNGCRDVVRLAPVRLVLVVACEQRIARDQANPAQRNAHDLVDTRFVS